MVLSVFNDIGRTVARPSGPRLLHIINHGYVDQGMRFLYPWLFTSQTLFSFL